LIGKSLIRMVDEQFGKLSKDNLLEVNIAGIANSRKMLFKEAGIELGKAVVELQSSPESMCIKTFIDRMCALNLPNSIFVDCTSSEDVTEYYEDIFSSNVSIVTPNKKANSGSLEKYKRLRTKAFSRGVKFLFETNVGAGLPVINTLNDLILSGDKVISIEGVLSGTLNYIFSTYAEGKKFSDVVREAKAKGYTEPDPRDDLSGRDVARKILILARESGIDLEFEDIQIENLVPDDCRGDLTVEQFFERLEGHDNGFAKLLQETQQKGEKLRYKAVMKNGKVDVQLGSVSTDHPFYSLSGSDNIILLTTERYHDRPMVIRGPGAGAEVTAAGVFADIIRIGHYAK
jgi:aspartokinase/homoserine dehydrogenase 1